MPPKLIAFTGKAGCGKSTAANALISTFHATEMSFADPLRITAAVFGFDPDDREMKEVPSEEHNGVSYRQFAQQLGDFIKA